MESKNINHARLITLDPRGIIIRDTTYTSGKGAQPSRMLIGPQELLFIAGFSQVEDADPQAPESKTVITNKGWMVVGEPFTPYKDPCVKEERGF